MKTGMYGQEIDFFCKNADGSIMRDLDKADNIKIRMKLNEHPIIEKDCTLISEPLGQVQYTMEEGILTEEGELHYEIVVISVGKNIPCETGMISINPSLEELD